MKNILIIIILFLTTTLQAQEFPFSFWQSGGDAPIVGQTFYVDNSAGDDALDGRSPATAWLSVGKVNSTTFVAGDTVRFKGGQTHAGRVKFLEDVGSASQPIVIGSYGTGKAILFELHLDSLEGGAGGGGFFKIVNIEIAGSYVITSPWTGSTTDAGIYAKNWTGVQAGYIIIDSVLIHHHKATGIGVYSDTNITGGYDSLVIRNSVFRDCGEYAIALSGLKYQIIRIRNNRMYDIRGFGAYQDNDYYTGYGIGCSNVNGALIERNVIGGNMGLYARAGGGGIVFGNSNDITVQHNEIYGYYGSGNDTADSEGIDMDFGSDSCIIQYNYVHGGQGTGILIAGDESGNPAVGNIVRYNILIDNAQQHGYGSIVIAAYRTESKPTGNIVYNNTIVSTGDNVCFFMANRSESTTISNNLFFANGGSSGHIVIDSIAKHNSLVVNGNNYWGDVTQFNAQAPIGTFFTTLAGFQTLGYEANGYNYNSYLIEINPPRDTVGKNPVIGGAYFLDTINAYKTLRGFPLRERGIDIGVGSTAYDFYETDVADWGLYDIGAYEDTSTYSFDLDATAWFGSMITQPTLARRYLNDSLIKNLKTDTIWTQLVRFGMFAAQDTIQAHTDWKDPTKFTRRVPTLPTFTVDRGFKSIAHNGALNTFFIPLSHGGSLFTLNDCAFDIYSRTDTNDGSVSATDFGSADFAQGSYYIGFIRGNDLIYYFVNDATGSNFANTTSIGLYTFDRTSSSNKRVFKNGVLLASATVTSIALPQWEMYIGGRTVNGSTWDNGTTREYSFYAIRKSMSEYRTGQLYTRMNTYRGRVGY